jgi:hypothetical protein
MLKSAAKADLSLPEFLAGKVFVRNAYGTVPRDSERSQWQRIHDVDPQLTERQWRVARDRYLVRAGEVLLAFNDANRPPR